ncbi:DNA-processing protein DprA [Alcanivorax sp. JB21]|uniref:DNA-processing protein DprA n=1 Tax=Alcanivorax limicola TaxID=2874102 RepID=UPI001CBAE561|nr:DNA-processing protein DprA [Alcanivorax limicola]MBZ2189023.1 DNA-processing protein DprA [Alcanivorax limicola]
MDGHRPGLQSLQARLVLSLYFGTAAPALGRLLRDSKQSVEQLAADPPRLQRALPPGLRQRPLPAPADVARWAAWLPAHGWQLIALGDPAYPPLLETLSDAPGMLYVRGDVALLQAPQLAIVGARSASPEGLDQARAFSHALACKGFVITSGLALGIDAAAHEGALSAAKNATHASTQATIQATTLAVMASGPDRLYPPRNKALAERIVNAGGALVTEYPPGTAPCKEHFPLRNRIISGLSLGTIVVEAALRSGSLITARLAAEQGRAVFAMPGSLRNPLSRGCHRLLRDGAHWLETLDDILAHFDEFTALVDGCEAESDPAQGRAQDGAKNAQQSRPVSPVLTAMRDGINTLDTLQASTGMPVPALAAELARLEIEGRVQRLPGGYMLR